MNTVLFVGNSFTYYNDLPAMVTQLSGGLRVLRRAARSVLEGR